MFHALIFMVNINFTSVLWIKPISGTEIYLTCQLHTDALKHFLQKSLLKPDNWILSCDYVLTAICKVILFDISVLQVLKSTFSCSFGSISWIWAFRVRFSWGKFAFAAMCTHEYARSWVTLQCWLLSWISRLQNVWRLGCQSLLY